MRAVQLSLRESSWVTWVTQLTLSRCSTRRRFINVDVMAPSHSRASVLFLLASCTTITSASILTRKARHDALIIAATSDDGAASSDGGPLSRLRQRLPTLTREKLYACAGGAAGALVGYSTTPRKTDPLAGRVSTPEAWRRRIKAKQKIPLLERSPRIVAVAIVGYSVVEFALAYQDGEAPIDCLECVYAYRVARDAALKAKAACDGVGERALACVDGVKAKLQR